MELPVEELVVLLRPAGGLGAEQGGDHRDAVESPGRATSAPASSASVGGTSQKAQTWSLTAPAATCPGHRAIIGTRMPPSYRSRLMPRRGPLLSKKSGSKPLPPSRCGPLSLVKKTMVSSSMPELLELRHQPADVAVHPGDHRGLALLGRRASPRRRRGRGRAPPCRCRWSRQPSLLAWGIVSGEVEEERPVPVLLEPARAPPRRTGRASRSRAPRRHLLVRADHVAGQLDLAPAAARGSRGSSCGRGADSGSRRNNRTPAGSGRPVEPASPRPHLPISAVS